MQIIGIDAGPIAPGGSMTFPAGIADTLYLSNNSGVGANYTISVNNGPVTPGTIIAGGTVNIDINCAMFRLANPGPVNIQVDYDPCPLRQKKEVEIKYYDASPVQYTLTAKNNSTNPTNLAVFQQDPDIGVSNVFSLAWFSKFAYQNTTVKFSWEIDYSFVWGETGILAPGVLFDASQVLDAGLETDNQTSLNYDTDNRAYFFTPTVTAQPTGILRVIQTKTVPLKQASVGIGMSGSGTFVVQAQPNLTLNFTPHPKYYIVAGNYSQGQVLDIAETTNAAEVAFPPGVYQMTAILNEDNTWTIEPTLAVNKRFLAKGGQWGMRY